MLTRYPVRPFGCALVLVIAWLVTFSPVARAQSLSWDADGVPPANGGTGSWIGGSTWFNGTSDVAWDNSGSAIAVMPSAAGTVSIGSGQTVNLSEIAIANTNGNYRIGGASLSTIGTASNGTMAFSGTDGTISMQVTSPSLGQAINSNITGTNLWIANEVTGTGAGTASICSLGGNNFLTGTIYLSGATPATAFNMRNVLAVASPGALGSQDGTNTFSNPTINVQRDFSQLAWGTGFNTGTFSATYNNNIVLNPNNIDVGTGAFNQTGTFNFGIGIGNLSAAIQFNGVISGNSHLSFSNGLSGGNGILVLNNNNTYTGDTYDFAGTLSVMRILVDNAFPTTTGFNFGATSAGTQTPGALDLNGHNQTFAYLRTTVTDGSSATGLTGYSGGIVNGVAALATVTVNGTAATTYRSPIGSGGVPSQTQLPGTKSTNIRLVLDPANTGTLTLSTGSMSSQGFSYNDYSGGTDIRGGTLYVNTTNGTGTLASGTGSGSVTVGQGTLAARIGGTGPITGDLHLYNLGEVSPGTTGSNVGQMHTGNEEWGVGASYRFDITDATGAAGTGYDQVKLDKNSGAVNLTSNSGSKFTVSINGTPTNLGTSHDWIIADGTNAVQLNGTPVDAGTAAAFNAGDWMNYFVIDNSNFTNNAGIQSVQISGDLTDIVLHYEVPEPSCMAMLLAGAGLLLRRNKRRQHAA